jgi:hypothetical protein
MIVSYVSLVLLFIFFGFTFQVIVVTFQLIGGFVTFLLLKIYHGKNFISYGDLWMDTTYFFSFVGKFYVN